MARTTLAPRVSMPTSTPGRAHTARPWPGRLLGWAARGLGGLVALVLLLAGAGFAYQTIATEQDQRSYPPPGQLVDVGGHRLHVHCVGDGSPTVITESGFGGTSLDWSLVQPAVAQTTRVCAYDRAGLGWSDAGPSPRTSARLAEELHTLLARAGIPGPYVLVGHSLGGLHVQLFASQYPGDVAGLVLLDPTPATYLASLAPEARRAAAPPSAQFRLIQVIHPFGLTRLLGLRVPMPVERLSAETQQQVKAVSFKPGVGAALYEEGSAFEADLAEATTAGLPHADIPLVVLVRGSVMGPPDQDAAGKAASADLVRRSARGQLLVAEHSGHFIQLEQPDLVVDAIRRLVQHAA